MITTISDEKEREMETNFFWEELGDTDWLFSASPLLEIEPELNSIQEGEEYTQSGDSAPNFQECQVCASHPSGPQFSDPWQRIRQRKQSNPRPKTSHLKGIQRVQVIPSLPLVATTQFGIALWIMMGPGEAPVMEILASPHTLRSGASILCLLHKKKIFGS